MCRPGGSWRIRAGGAWRRRRPSPRRRSEAGRISFYYVTRRIDREPGRVPRLFLLVPVELVGMDAVPGHGQHGGRGRLRDGLTLALGEEAAQAGVFGGAGVEG